MANNTFILLANSFKSWVSARGFLMVLFAALVPLLLTGAWVGTHQKDVSATNLSWSPNPPTEGQNVTITADIVNKGRFAIKDDFNATLTVGRVSAGANGVELITDTANTTVIHGLGAGETKHINMTWTARTGYFVVLADADSSDKVPEIEEFNNQLPMWLEVRYKIPNATDAPKAPGNLTGNASTNGTSDVAVTGIDWTPSDIHPNDNVTITANITNKGPDPVTDANITLQVGQVFSNQIFASRDIKTNLTLQSGETKQVTLTWNQIPPGPYWIQAYANVTKSHDPDGANNELAKPFIIHIRVGADAKFPEPPARATIKQFYFDILAGLHLQVIIPFIALFYAGGVLSDEREKGNLVYILTRPVPRALIPISKFVASFIVAAVATSIGIIGTFFLLLGTPQSDLGFLVTPLLISLISLFAYGALFVLLGVLFDRAYLVGLAVLGWEWAIVLGETINLGNRPLVAGWVKNFTVSYHLVQAFRGWWKLDDKLHLPLRWLPAGAKAMQELQWVAIGAFVCLIASAIIMRRREFDL